MTYKALPSVSIILPCVAAGPLFLVSTALAAFYLQLPEPLVVPLDVAGLFVMILVPSVIVGSLLSFVPNWIGSRLLLLIGEILPASRSRLVWLGAGILLGSLIAWLASAFDSPPIAFGLIATSACSAAISRHSACWD